MQGLPWWFNWCRICRQGGRPEFKPWVGKSPWRKKMLPIPVFLPGEFHELYSPHSMDYTVHGVSKSQTWPSDFHLPLQGTWVCSLVQEPSSHMQLRRYPAMTEPWNPRVLVLQQEKPPQWEAHTMQLESSPLLLKLQLGIAILSNKELWPRAAQKFLKMKKRKEKALRHQAGFGISPDVGLLQSLPGCPWASLSPLLRCTRYLETVSASGLQPHLPS